MTEQKTGACDSLVELFHGGGLDASPGLLAGGDDLVGRQNEAVAALVPQFEGVYEWDAEDAVGPVVGSTGGGIYEKIKNVDYTPRSPIIGQQCP